MGLETLARAVHLRVPTGDRRDVSADGVRQSLRQRRDPSAPAGTPRIASPTRSLPLVVEITGPAGSAPAGSRGTLVGSRRTGAAGPPLERTGRRSAQPAAGARRPRGGREAARRGRPGCGDEPAPGRHHHRPRHRRLPAVAAPDDLDPDLGTVVEPAGQAPRPAHRATRSPAAGRLSARIDEARADTRGPVPGARSATSSTIASGTRSRCSSAGPAGANERLTRRTPLSEGEKKIVTYLPTVRGRRRVLRFPCRRPRPTYPGSCCSTTPSPRSRRTTTPSCFGLLVELDLDFIATSERLWGTHATVPELAIAEVIRDAGLGVIVLEHSRWDGSLTAPAG